MSVEIVHVVRGQCKITGKKYKLVRGQVRQPHEARGEDVFPSIFFAIHSASRAAKTWRKMSDTIIFTVVPVKSINGELVEEDGDGGS
jgi:hypothetical protein